MGKLIQPQQKSAREGPGVKTKLQANKDIKEHAIPVFMCLILCMVSHTDSYNI